MISETKLDESFPSGQFLLDGYSAPFRFDKNGILLYIKEHISSKFLSMNENSGFFFVEINLRKEQKVATKLFI